MKKTIIILLIGVFSLTGCSLGKNNSANNTTVTQPKQEAKPVATTLLGWLQNGEAVACTVNTLNGDVLI
ncbi:MAG: hypothetical protein NTW06_00605, partial [Candidatus Falkowbacteria bacterium]|nr:hypothetical protein [Candidatus Falkowbacteria bacterium]